MASSPLRSKSHFHVRSISLTSTSYPIINQINEHLSRVSAFEATSLLSSSRISGLESLFDCVNGLLQLPKTQQVFTQECHKKLVDEVLDIYLSFLDLCTASKDVLSQTKQDVQELLSILRRKKDDGGTKVQSRPLTLSLVSILMHQKSMACRDHEEIDTNEFEKVDAALYSFSGHNTGKSDAKPTRKLGAEH